MNPISYCMNVHPGESVEAVLRALRESTLPITAALKSPDFGIGLRLSAEAAAELRDADTLSRFRQFFRNNRLRTIGINGFPFGNFHMRPVKTAVYEPDWATEARSIYTHDLFYLLSSLPELPGTNTPISVTTVPLAYDRGQGISRPILDNICEIALFLRKLEGFTGRRMMLALEPEPDCLLDTATNTIAFFETLWHHPLWSPLNTPYIGLCFDTCHFAVNFEDPLVALRSIVGAGIPIARIQISAALEFHEDTPTQALAPFLDSVYLHQTRTLGSDGTLNRYPDLTPDILPALRGLRGRTHFHVPLAWKGNQSLRSTRDTLTPDFWRYVKNHGWPLELETYTYRVLPSALRSQTLSEMIVYDFRWMQEQLRRA